METTNTLITKIMKHTLGRPCRRIVGRAALVKALFAHLCAQQSALPELILLCARDGFILHCENGTCRPCENGPCNSSSEELTGLTDGLSADTNGLCGRTLDLTALKASGLLKDFNSQALDDSGAPNGFNGESLSFQAIDDYLIIAAADRNFNPRVNFLGALGANLSELLKIIDTDESTNGYLLKCLNSVKNAISIYDENATLLYANTSFCKDLSISNLSSAIGSDINTLTKTIGIKIHSMEDNSSRLKMMDVLKHGKEIIDWEVRIESANSKSESKLLSNDMYPVLDESGKVTGMVELTHSRKQDIKRARKIMGLAAEYTFDSIIGSSQAIREQIRRAKEFANSPFNFLITGESGVGKELFAQSIHNYSDRKKGPFVALNCANFSDGLIESELFGYIGGAFTGASKNGQTGKFELANGGTLFLDEIGELPYHFQSKLLRVLETWTVTRIGSSQQIPVDVRLVAATNRNLDEMVSEGVFRQDLYYRLQVLNIEIPPLRERKEDLPLLSECFLRQALDPNSDAPKVLDSDAQAALMEYDWPGNVRELRNVINRVSILSKGQVITRDVLEASIYSKGRAVRPNGNTSLPGGNAFLPGGNPAMSGEKAGGENTAMSNPSAALPGEGVSASDRSSAMIGENVSVSGEGSTMFGQGAAASGKAGAVPVQGAAKPDETSKQREDAAPEDRLNRIRSEIDASYLHLINEALDIAHGNKKQAAELLGVSRKTLYRMLEKFMHNGPQTAGNNKL